MFLTSLLKFKRARFKSCIKELEKLTNQLFEDKKVYPELTEEFMKEFDKYLHSKEKTGKQKLKDLEYRISQLEIQFFGLNKQKRGEK
jgi:hypothetical protein